jgi:hypothetical protein
VEEEVVMYLPNLNGSDSLFINCELVRVHPKSNPALPGSSSWAVLEVEVESGRGWSGE